jgi:hypothetical protein
MQIILRIKTIGYIIQAAIRPLTTSVFIRAVRINSWQPVRTSSYNQQHYLRFQATVHLSSKNKQLK